MQADFKIVIDACVLANIAVCDMSLRLAEGQGGEEARYWRSRRETICIVPVPN